MRIEPEIIKHYAVLSVNKRTDWKRELNSISWGGEEAKYDIRDWDEDHERSRKCGTYTAEELRNLRDVLNQMNLETE